MEILKIQFYKYLYFDWRNFLSQEKEANSRNWEKTAPPQILQRRQNQEG